VGLTAALTVAGLVACSSEETSPAKSTTIVMPNLVGKFWDEAQPQLRSLGWEGFIVKGPDVPAAPQDHNRVLFQSPAAGEPVKHDGDITLRFGS
jgi:serine/threonine-protein kinase